MVRRSLFFLCAAMAVLAGSVGTASAAPTTSYTSVVVPSPYPWEAPITVDVTGSRVLESINQGPQIAKLAVNVAPTTTDPIYSQPWRLLDYGTHTEIRWHNTTTGASGTAFSDERRGYPQGGATIGTGLGWVEYTVIATVGVFIPQINPQTITVTSAVEINDQPF